MNGTNTLTGSEIAVIGMSARFPGANNIDRYWENLKNGIETISFFSDEELAEVGVDSARYKNPLYVRANGALENIEYFDAAFFGYSPGEAEIMDPQTRFFLECCWEAMEDAGYEAGIQDRFIGVYAGAAENVYWKAKSLISGSGNVDAFSGSLFNNKDFVSLLVSYKLDLKGPSYSMFTSCSTSLVSIHIACQALLNGECDMALAGGVRISFPNKSGYMYQKGLISSPDGHCRPFAAEALGTLSGNGAGVVILKRLEDAVEDRDYIYAVVKGSAINNDGLRKVGFTAPSIEGQAEVIRTAQQMAQVEPESITYIEAHGTGTELGDPTEIEGLKLAFNSPKKGFCAVGSVKSNIGHLDAAAGVAGFIKTVLALKNRVIPPTLHCHRSNPSIDFANSPFYVNNTLSPWKSNRVPLRAGVSSFGIGGTNAHIVLEEWPETREKTSVTQGKPRLVILSAKSATALDKMTLNLADFFRRHPDLNLEDTAYTLQVGRKAFPYRRMVVCAELEEAVEALSAPDLGKLHSRIVKNENNPVVFMFPGQGSQYENMGRDLYRNEAVFREEMDICFEVLKPLLEYDIKDILFPGISGSGTGEGSGGEITQTGLAQPLLFCLEYALAKLLMHWGIRPYAMIGHSIGEYTAATLAGLYSLEDALKLVVARGKLMQAMPPGSMLSVSLAEEQLKPLLNNYNQLDLAAVNSDVNCVVSGPSDQVESFSKSLKEMGHESRILHTSHAFHSAMMEPLLQEFIEIVRDIKLNPTQLSFISNVTGNWSTKVQTADPNYWAVHLRNTVHFGRGIKVLLEKKNSVFIEVGPGKTLSTFVRQQSSQGDPPAVINLLRHPQENTPDDNYLLNKIGDIWLYGVKVDWSKFYPQEKRYRLPLPVYPFDKQRFPTEGSMSKLGTHIFSPRTLYRKSPDMENWFYVPVWEQSIPVPREYLQNRESLKWLLFVDDKGWGTRLEKMLFAHAQRVVTVKVGHQFKRIDDSHFLINPENSYDYGILLDQLQEMDMIPGRVVHLWNINGTNPLEAETVEIKKALERGPYSLLNLVQTMGRRRITDRIRILVVTESMQDVTGEEALNSLQATVLGPVKIIPLEYPNIECSSADIELPQKGSPHENKILHYLLAEFLPGNAETTTAYRGGYRWIRKVKPFRLEKSGGSGQLLREKGCYLITGGFGGMGFTIAEHLAITLKAKLVLVGRSAFPPRKEWENWRASHDENDRVSLRIGKILDWEEQGAEIIAASVDICDEKAMRGIIAWAEADFGPLNGVIHTAGLADYEGAIQKRTQQMTEKIMAPKVLGTIVLNRLFKNKKLDFFLLFSSIGNFLYKGKFGQVGYNIGNEFLDAFAHYKSRTGNMFTAAINWSDWLEVGMTIEAVKRRHGRNLQENDFQALLPDAITPQEGVVVFQRILEHRYSHVVIFTHDLVKTLELMEKEDITEIREEAALRTQSSSPVERPDYISTTYVPPQNKIQQQVAQIWERFFGFKQVGIHDDFFELGGDSLKAVTVISLLGKAGFKLSLNDMLAYPTVQGLAAVIDGNEMTSGNIDVEIGSSISQPKYECVQLLNKGGNKRNIFILHPLHGMVNQYKELAVLLENDFNVYGIQSRGLVPGAQLPLSPGEMVDDYLEQILALQPEGPFIIGGYCVGSKIAYDIVGKLERMNQAVLHVILFDSSAYSSRFIRMVRIHKYFPAILKKRLLDKRQRKFETEKAKIIDELTREKEKFGSDLYNERLQNYIAILTFFIMPQEIIKAPIVVAKAETNRHPLSTGTSFNKMTRNKASVVDVPGDHNSIFEKPHVAALATLIKNTISTQELKESI